MSLRYLAEHAENAKLALELAQKEAKHLTYPTFRTPIIENLNISKHTFRQAT